MGFTPSPALLEAAAYLSSAPSLPKVSNTTKLELYGLYKHLTVAPVPQNPRPSLFDLTGRAKWDAWSSIGEAYAGREADAEKRYLDVARELGWVPGSRESSNAQGEVEVWDEDLGVSISLSSSEARGGMGGSVSAMAAVDDEGDDAEGQGLHAFAIQGDANKVIHFFADNPSADVDQRDEYGYTPLHLACDRGNSTVVKVLIERGADATIQDPDDLTAIELAQIAGHDEICTFLQTELH